MSCTYKSVCDDYSEFKAYCRYGGGKCPVWRQKKSEEDKRRVLRDLIAVRDKCHKNCVRFSPYETKKHWMKKCSEAYDMHFGEGMDIWSEAHFTRSRHAMDAADLVGANEYSIIGREILHSEDKEDCLRKIKKYPKKIEDWKVVEA